MEDHELGKLRPSAWIPMSHPTDVGLLSKFQEELGECISAAARCLCQGIDESNPTTAKSNRVWLEDEIADVMAFFQLISDRFELDRDRIHARAEKKHDYHVQWTEMLDSYSTIP
jgi:hypothetical protein